MELNHLERIENVFSWNSKYHEMQFGKAPYSEILKGCNFTSPLKDPKIRFVNKKI